MVRQMFELVLGVFAVWIAWQIANIWLTAEPWVWWCVCVVAGVAWVCAFISPSWWWEGLGVGGGAVFVGLVADCLLLLGDFARVSVLRNSRSS